MAFSSNQLPGRTAVCERGEYLFFSGTSYLAMNSNPEFIDLVVEGMKQYGGNYSSSRNSNFRLKIYEEAEGELAASTSAGAALTVSSGYMAGQLVITALEGKGKFIYAPDAHPATWRKSSDYYAGNFQSWAGGLQEQISASDEGDVFIVTNSIDPLFVKPYNFGWITSLTANRKITIIIDDSHGFGITGTEGSGIWKQLNHPPHVNVIVVSSFGKAMGIPGGIILSDIDTISMLRRSPFFNTASPIAPAYLHAYLKSAHLYREARKKLTRNISQFRSLIGASDWFRHMDNYPVFYSYNNQLQPFLEQENILISSFAYPLPDDDLITRIIINSSHQPDDITYLSDCIDAFFGADIFSR
jgi:8-amino-7-oxononanoate synthase